MPFISFAPNTTIKSTDVNTNFTNSVHVSDVQKVSNKIPVPAIVSSSSGAFALDLGSVFVRTLNGTNNTLSLSNEDVGQIFLVEIIEDGTGPIWFAGISWGDGVAPSPSASTKRDVYGFRVLSEGTYYGTVIARGI